MTGSGRTTAPVNAGRSRKPMSWSSRVALLALTLMAVFALPGLARAAGPASNLDQCRNGAFTAQVVCTGGAWQNGDLGATNSHYREGDSVPFRTQLTNLTAGDSYTVSLNYDPLQSGGHAYDYLTSYKATETTADATPGIAGLGAETTFPIPPDLSIAFTPA